MLSSFDKDTKRMSVAIEATARLRTLRPDSEPLKRTFPRLARHLNTTARRVRAMWEGTATVIYAEELDALRAACAAKAETSFKTEALANAVELETYAARLAQMDPDLYRQEIARLRDVALHARRFVGGKG